MKIGRVIVHPLRLPLPYEDLEGAAPVAAALDTPIAPARPSMAGSA